MKGPDGIELFHGYTYSGHPLACAAGNAALDIYREEGLFSRAKELAPYWEDALHGLRGLPHVMDIRNIGLVGAIELEPVPGRPTERAVNAFRQAFDKGLLIRTTADTIALSPPLIVEKAQIDQIAETLRAILKV
jgi:beta-alanine--pyruvate transaminase